MGRWLRHTLSRTINADRDLLKYSTMNTIPKTDYDNKLHEVYHQARNLPEQTTHLWMEYLSRYVSKDSPITFLDLGSGTGRFSKVIADRFDCRVIGIEPSDKMRVKAEQCIHDGRIRFLKGDASIIAFY
jgi:ubiquinone/menaquinone biosynthesis C-methylase UbiE